MRVGWLLPLLLLAACGGEESPQKAPPGPPGESGTTAKKSAAADDLRSRFREEERKFKALEAVHRQKEKAAKEADAALDALIDRHQQEKEGLASAVTLEDQLRRARRRARRAENLMKNVEQQLADLKEAGAGGLGELKSLQEERDKLESDLDDAIFSRRRAAVLEGVGVLEESPVAQELRRLRAIRAHWFQVTDPIRADGADAATRQQANRTFREWLAKDDAGTALVEKALQKSKKKTKLERYDFTSLEFFLLVQILEAELDKQNIEKVREESKELAQVVQMLEQKIAAVDAKIDVLREGSEGAELTEYAELSEQLAARRAEAAQARKKVEQWEKELAPYLELKARHEKEMAEAERLYEETKKEAAKVLKEIEAVWKERNRLAAELKKLEDG